MISDSMTYEIIGTGSTGNAVIINGEIMIDCGMPWKDIEPYTDALRLVLLTHKHGDHFRVSCIRSLHEKRPGLRFGACQWMAGKLSEAGVSPRVIDFYEPSRIYTYGALSVSPEELVHDVPNCGYRIFLPNGEKLFYATDTGTMDGIKAAGYDLYMLEANHTEKEIEERVAEKMASGEYAYEFRAAQNHLSREQAEDWLYQNMGPNSRYLFLHQHSERKG